MREVMVPTASPYSVLIGSGLLAQTGARVRELLAPASVVIVTDATVRALYEPVVRQSLQDAGIRTETFCIEAGEASKNAQNYLALLNFLARAGLTRTDAIVALGGGVVGDLAGFAAATCLRGIAFVQLPTTLLAAVDSSVGGKTAIDLDAGKNLAGAFWQPRLVLCDTDTLDTLTPEIFADGCAEVIKYAVLFDRGLFAHLDEYGLGFDREAVIELCVQMKRDVVAEDEFDRGRRQLLNLGHTLGHAVEACSNFSVSHGKAVAIGMACVARAAEAAGECDCAADVERLLDRFGLPKAAPYPMSQLAQRMLSDKKRRSDTITLIVPRRIGSCELQTMPVDALAAYLQAGLTEKTT